MLLVFEDAHWIDPTTLELMELTVERATDSAVLVLITYRPEFEAPWNGRPRVTPLVLSRLERRDCERMVEALTDGEALPEEVCDRISKQTDGVPLFIEEITRSVLETGTGPAETAITIEVPASLQDSLEARLDRLGSAKDIAQVGAVIGRTFEYRLLCHVVPLEDEVLRTNLEQLVGSDLVTTRGVPPAATYTFKHALVQDTAYNSLLRTRRAELHGEIARAVTDENPEVAASEPELLAHHFTEAGLIEPAIEHWRAAGQISMRRSANKEAIEHFKRAFDLLPKLPQTSNPDRVELRKEQNENP